MIEIFGFPEDKIICPNCRNAVRLCELNGAPYKFYPIIDDIFRGKIIRNMPNTNDLLQRLGKSSNESIKVPQIFVNGQHIGGLADLKVYFKSL